MNDTNEHETQTTPAGLGESQETLLDYVQAESTRRGLNYFTVLAIVLAKKGN